MSSRSFLAALAPLLFGALPPLAQADEAAELAALIDRHVQASLDAAGLKPAPAADDAEFLRRVCLDLHGVVPSAEQVRFLASSNSARRSQLIDDLLANPRYGEHFGDLWRKRLVSPLVSEERQRSDRF